MLRRMIKMKIEVLGSGCPKCKKLEENVKNALRITGIKADVLKVTDIREIASSGVLSTPALRVDGKVVLEGEIPSPEKLALEAKKW